MNRLLVPIPVLTERKFLTTTKAVKRLWDLQVVVHEVDRKLPDWVFFVKTAFTALR